jgi:hypothetical protein
MHHFPIEEFFYKTCRIVLHCHPSRATRHTWRLSRRLQLQEQRLTRRALPGNGPEVPGLHTARPLTTPCRMHVPK